MTFPQLPFFRSPHAHNHWVLASEAVLDGAALLITACDVRRQSSDRQRWARLAPVGAGTPACGAARWIGS
jgi:hypothetical protein